MKAYSGGARTGAPPATQVADRFHLLQNLAEALDQVFSAHGKAFKAVSAALISIPVVQPDGRTAVPVPPSAPTHQEQTRAAQRRARRLATYDQVWTLNRRSQRRSFTWEGFSRYRRRHPLPRPGRLIRLTPVG